MKRVNEDRLPVAALRNLGPRSAVILAQAGIATVAELRLIGPAKAYRRAKSFAPAKVSLNLLWAIAAGLENRDWHEISDEEKRSLLAQVRGLG